MVSQKIFKMNSKWRKRLLEALSFVFIKLCKRNDPVIHGGERSLCSFNSIETFPMKINTYLIRIANYTNCSNESLIFSLIYIDKLIAKNQKFMVTSQNVHLLVLTSIVIAVKFYDDQLYKNSFYAEVGGVSCRSLMRLEMLFTLEIEFELSVEKSLYSKYCKSLKRAVVNKSLSRRKLATESPEAASHIESHVSKFVLNAERESECSENAKPVNMPVSSRPCSRNFQHREEDSHKQSTRYKTKLVYLPGHCFGMKLSNWQVPCRPMICVAGPDVTYCA